MDGATTDKTVQTNVRVSAADHGLIVSLAQRLRSEPAFRDRLRLLLDNDDDTVLGDRVKKLERQVSWLLSGAIVVPRSVPRMVPEPVVARPSLIPGK